MLVALAAWTKNEGLLFLGVFSVVLIGVSLLWRWPVSLREQILPFIVGAAPILLLVAYFKGSLVGPSDLIAGQSQLSLLARLTSPARYWQILRTFVVWFSIFGRGSIVVLVLYVLSTGLDLKSDAIRAGVMAALTVVLMLMGYFFVFVTTPHDLAWHLTAFERLLVQLWPSLLLAVLLLAGTPIRTQTYLQLSQEQRPVDIPSLLRSES